MMRSIFPTVLIAACLSISSIAQACNTPEISPTSTRVGGQVQFACEADETVTVVAVQVTGEAWNATVPLVRGKTNARYQATIQSPPKAGTYAVRFITVWHGGEEQTGPVYLLNVAE